MPICKLRDDGAGMRFRQLETVHPQEIPIKVCVLFCNIKICYRGCGEKGSFLAII